MVIVRHRQDRRDFG